jgi:hypothetical protein
VVRAVAAGWARLGDKSLFHQWWANANRKRAGRGLHRLSVRRDCWDLGSSLAAANALLSFPWTSQIQDGAAGSGVRLRNGLADRSDPGATAVAKLIIELRKRANAIPSAGANGLARTVKVSRRRNSGAADVFLSGARNAHKHSAELSHEVSAPTKEDDEGTNVGVGTALCSQSAPRKT